jgi:hypothetical protein
MAYPSPHLYPSPSLYPSTQLPPPTVGQPAAWDETSHLFAGVEINQDRTPDPNDFLVPTDWQYQTFRLPSWYKRGGTGTQGAVVESHDQFAKPYHDEAIPDIVGFAVNVEIDGSATDAYLDYTLEFDLPSVGWQRLASGTSYGAQAGGNRVWFDIYFDNAIEIPRDLLSVQYRFGVRGNVDKLWFSTPPPFPTEFMMDSDGNLDRTGNLLFRLLSSSADWGGDFLNNLYRSVAVRHTVSKLSTQNTNEPNTFWLSKPNPSKFAVESLYFDMRDDLGEATVVDRLLIDPITPGVYFHIYYSNEGEAENTTEGWEGKLWNPVHRSFYLDKRQEFVLPEPINAKFIAVEFSHLQAQPYKPGLFQQPIKYRKHPKWVLDFFLARASIRNTGDRFINDQIEVRLNVLNLAYNYYLDDLHQNPRNPATIPSAETDQLLGFLTERNDLSDQVDRATLERISTIMHRFQLQPGERGNFLQYLPAMYTTIPDSTISYPTELPPPSQPSLNEVSSLDREQVAFEQGFPVMFFYLTSRHFYRQVQATFQYDRAYFVGIRELAFTRDHYTVAEDTPIYVDVLGDHVNAWRNDF